MINDHEFHVHGAGAGGAWIWIWMAARVAAWLSSRHFHFRHLFAFFPPKLSPP
jgi:hypothetical protein